MDVKVLKFNFKKLKYTLLVLIILVLIISSSMNGLYLKRRSWLILNKINKITENSRFGFTYDIKKNKKWAYGFFAITKSHFIAAMLNIKRLKDQRQEMDRDKRNVDFLVLTNINLPSWAVLCSDVKLIKYPKLPSPDGYYQGSFVKLLFFNMTDYYRIIYMDVDAIVIKPMDEMFDLPSSVSLASPVAYWENELCFTSALLILKPDSKTWAHIVHKMDNITAKHKADMDLLNELYDRRITVSFKIYPDILLLPGYFLILSSHLRDKSQSYHTKFGAIFENVEDLVNKTYIVHFSGQSKPWELSKEEIFSQETISKYFQDFNLQFKYEYKAIEMFLLKNKRPTNYSLRQLFRDMQTVSTGNVSSSMMKAH